MAHPSDSYAEIHRILSIRRLRSGTLLLDLSRTGRLVYHLVGISAVLFIVMALSDHVISRPKDEGANKKGP